MPELGQNPPKLKCNLRKYISICVIVHIEVCVFTSVNSGYETDDMANFVSGKSNSALAH